MNDFIKNAEKFIAEHLQDEFTLNEIAGFCGYSSFHFAHKFKETENISVMGYIRKKRILLLLNLLKTAPAYAMRQWNTVLKPTQDLPKHSMPFLAAAPEITPLIAAVIIGKDLII